MLSYQWRGMEEAQRRIARLASLDGLAPELEAGADVIVAEARIEPAERPGQRYRRTHRLSGSWRRTDARRGGQAIRVDVENPVEYGPFVQGDDQAETHRGRWRKLKTIGDEQLPALRARVQAWAVRTWRGR